MNLIVTLQLLKFNNAEVITNEEGVRGVFLPIEENGFYEGSKDINVTLYVNERSANTFNQSHYVKQGFWKKMKEKLTDLGWEEQFVGYAKINALFNSNPKVNKRKSLDEILGK